MIVVTGALLIGISLGLLGSGGSTLTVPVLVYLVGHSAKVSIAESMAIVGLISVAAAVPYAKSRQVDWRSVAFFGLPGMLGTFVGAWLGGLAADAYQLITFGVVLLVAAVYMVRQGFQKTHETNSCPDADSFVHPGKIIAEGLVVGIVTGFVGVGGGFLIVPALVVFGKLPMRLAIGTSLVIVFLKSVIGFAKYQYDLSSHGISVDWVTIAVFGLAGVLGSLIGQKLNQKLNQRSLSQIFAIFLIFMGSFVVIKEGGKLFSVQETDLTKNPITALQKESHTATDPIGQINRNSGWPAARLSEQPPRLNRTNDSRFLTFHRFQGLLPRPR